MTYLAEEQDSMTPLLELRQQHLEEEDLPASIDKLLLLLQSRELQVLQFRCREVRVLAHLPQLGQCLSSVRQKRNSLDVYTPP